jgi:hypothetical protein
MMTLFPPRDDGMTQSFLPSLDYFYFTTVEKKILEIYTGLNGELEHLKIIMRLIEKFEKFPSVMCVCVFVKYRSPV